MMDFIRQSLFHGQTAIQRLRAPGLLSRLSTTKPYPNLISASELNHLRQLASQATPTTLDLNLEVHHRMLGERLSPFAKNGFEFAETRLYQHGDNVRFINWRRYANSGQLFINSFHEERRPQCWILLDRRASMRFGTQVRLKVTQAATLALFNLFKAQRQQFDIGGIVLDEQSHWYEVKSSSTSFQPLIQHICSACPPLPDHADDQLAQNLRLLKTRLAPGCLIIVVSDFIDLKQADLNILSALSSQHTVSTLHIVDPIEKTLPKQGQFQILNAEDDSLIQLNCSNSSSREYYQTILQARLDNIEQQLKQSKTLYQQVDSTAELLTTSHMAES